MLLVEDGAEKQRLSAARGRAVPHVAFLDAQGALLAPYQGAWTVEALEQALTRLDRLLELRARLQRSRSDEVDLLALEVQLSAIDVAAARKRAEALRLDVDERGRIDEVLADRVVLDLWYERQPRTRDGRLALGAAYFDLFERDRVRPREQAAAEAFYLLMLEHAEAARSAERFERALDGLRVWLGERSDACTILHPLEARLAALRRG